MMNASLTSRLKGLLCLCVLSFSVSANGLNGPNSEHYSQALSFIKQKQWSLGLNKLDQINEPSPQVLYMKIQILLKLMQYEAAQDAISKLMLIADWQDIAWFYSGVLANQRGNLGLAHQWFTEVVNNSQRIALIQRSNQALEQLVKIKQQTKLSVGLQITEHYDTLHFKAAEASTNSSDDLGTSLNVFSELDKTTYRIQGYYHEREQGSDTSLETQQYGVGYFRTLEEGDYRADYYQLKSDAFHYKAFSQSYLTPISASWLSDLVLGWSLFDGESGYSFLNGQRYLFEVNKQWPSSIRLSYRIEKDARKDAPSLSYSPLLLSSNVQWQYSINPQSELFVQAWFEKRRWDSHDDRHAYNHGFNLQYFYNMNANVTFLFHSNYELWREFGKLSFADETLSISLGCRLNLNSVTF